MIVLHIRLEIMFVRRKKIPRTFQGVYILLENSFRSIVWTVNGIPPVTLFTHGAFWISASDALRYQKNIFRWKVCAVPLKRPIFHEFCQKVAKFTRLSIFPSHNICHLPTSLHLRPISHIWWWGDVLTILTVTRWVTIYVTHIWKNSQPVSVKSMHVVKGIISPWISIRKCADIVW